MVLSSPVPLRPNKSWQESSSAIVTMWFSSLGLLISLASCIHNALAAGAPVFFFTQFTTSTTPLRDELISRMHNISRFSCTDEPGVSKYALVIPRGGGDNLTAYSIEQ